MECGCTLERHELVNASLNMNNRLVCKKHRKRIKAKFSYCEECGKKITLHGSSGRLPRKCAVCSPPRKKPADSFELNKSAEILIERSDCIYRPLCIEVHIKKPNLPCVKCQDYEPSDSLTDLIYAVNLCELDTVIERANSLSSTNQKQIIENEARLKWGKIYDKRNRDIQKNSRLRNAG